MPAFSKLPAEVVENILKLSDAVDILSISQICSVFREIAKISKSLWVKQALNLHERHRPLSLPQHDTLAKFTLTELKNAVLCAARLEKNFNRPNPQLLSWSKLEKIPLYEVDDGDTFHMWSIGLNCILLAKKSGHFLVWDMGRSLLIGEDEIGKGTVIQTLKTKITKDLIQVYCITRFYFDEEGSLTEDDVDEEGLMNLKVVRIDCPLSESSPNSFRIEELSSFQCHYNFIDMTILDVERKLVATIIKEGESQNQKLSIFIIKNWEIGNHFTIDCQIPYRMECGYALSYNSKQNELHLREISCEMDSDITFSLNLAEDAGNQLSEIIKGLKADALPRLFRWKERSFDIMKPVSKHIFQSKLEFPSLSTPTRNDLTSTVFFTCLDWHPRYREITTEWGLIQYYSTTDGPCGKRRCVVRMKYPMEDNRCKPHIEGTPPVMDVGFRNVVWVEDLGKSSWIVRIATFPSPDEGDGQEDVVVEATVKTLDVPEEIRHNTIAQQIILDESQGCVLLGGAFEEVHKLRYG